MAYVRQRRSGFSAIEIMVVITILGILAALTFGAVYRVRSSQERAATEATLSKLASEIDRHWKAVADAAKSEYDGLPSDIKQNLLDLANNPTTPITQPQPQPRRDERARLLYVKFRLKQEFPTSFAIAVNPARVTFNNVTKDYVPATVVPGTSNTNPPATWTGKPAYVKALFNVLSLQSIINKPAQLNLISTDKQSSALLVLILKQNHGGVSTTSIDQIIGGTFIRNDPATGLDYIVDTWNNPLQFYAFPAFAFDQTPSATDLDVQVTVPSGKTVLDAMKGVLTDPQDPEGLLLDKQIFSAPNTVIQNAQWTPTFAGRLFPAPNFAQALHPQIVPQTVNSGNPKIYKFRQLIPVIASAGPDGQFMNPNANPQKPDPVNQPDGWAAINPIMTLSGNPAFDNIYSFRLRQTGARGD